MGYKPRTANLDDVTIHRDADTAIIKFNDGETGTIHLKIGQAIECMSDSEIVALHNEIIRTQLELAASWHPTEIAPGYPQVKFDKAFGQWSAQGHVLRCTIEGGPASDEPSIKIDNHELSLQQFGALLSHFEGWGMRISFVDEDQLSDPPAPELRKAPKPLTKKELEELEALSRYENGIAQE